MQKTGTAVVFSPSDLNGFLECEHLLQLERAREDGEAPRPRDAHAELLAEKGREHERAWLERFRAEGRQIASIDPPPGPRDWGHDAARTLQAMRAGADVIYQGVLVDEEWHGISDFLVRVDMPSNLGAWSYEAWDTKLARHSKPYFILQLCYYTEQLARLQGVEPLSMHVVLGSGRRDTFRYRDFAAYYRAVRGRFVAAAREGRATEPYPVPHCGLCHHAPACEAQWERENHLSLVANIRRDQVEKLNEHGVATVAGLAGIDPAARIGIGAAPLARLRHQAALQDEHRRTGVHRYDLVPPGPENGFRLLPPPSNGDIFFDMEGFPYYEPARGLEYLFGVMTVDRQFQAFHASNREEEKIAFERFVDFVIDRFRRWPDLHVYHYAAYEPSTLQRLMSEHATREAEIDNLLRHDVFVDLYQVVRQSMRISHPSYSIKKVRTFFMASAGHGAVSDGGDSILAFEQWLQTGNPEILEAIERYNEEDCLSTIELRNWLLERRGEVQRRFGLELPWPAAPDAELSDARLEDDAATAERCHRLKALGTPAAALLADLLGYHRREEKPEWWAYFARHDKSLDDLVDDVESVAYVRERDGSAPEPRKKSRVHLLEFPPQETKLRPESKVRDPFNDCPAGEVVAINAAEGWLKLLRGPSLQAKPIPTALVPDKPVPSSTQRAALARVADDVLSGTRRFRAAHALIERELPRTEMGSGTISAVAGLDESYLFIQGPPGSGKTYTGARLIVSLLKAGRRIGVTATSHKAIHNLLEEVEAAAAGQGVEFRGLKKRTGSDESEFRGRFFENTENNEVCEGSDADVIAGTAWLFAREGMQSKVDYLFIDEAGQMSLADAVAVSTAACNVVLLGDPQQLPHVTQGVHPEHSGASVLEHLLGEAATVPPERGLFLAQSWRMHPEICAFVSEHSYDGRLTSAPGRERQRINRAQGSGPKAQGQEPGAQSALNGAGLRYIPVAHEGNAQQSPEEAAVIAEQVGLLLADGSFTDDEGATRPLTAKDILVVAPYNMQVRCLRERLPDGVEVGTVDKFQGREAPVVFFSMASSSGDDVPRGLEFLFNRNRFNVAVSRAKCLSVVVCSPRLLEARCGKVEQMRLVNAACEFVERSGAPELLI